MTRKRVVIDTSVLIAAGSKWVDPVEFVPNNDARAVLRNVIKVNKGIYSEQISAEYIRKLYQRKHPPERISKLIGLIIANFDFILTTSDTCSPTPADPKDVPFMICAYDGQANYLVSEDKHFLNLKSSCVSFMICNSPEAKAQLGA